MSCNQHPDVILRLLCRHAKVAIQKSSCHQQSTALTDITTSTNSTLGVLSNAPDVASACSLMSRQSCTPNHSPKVVPPPVVMSHEIVEEQDVQDQGHFIAFADGRVKVTFPDRTLLNMDSSHAVCQLLLPDGTRAEVAVTNPVGVEGYVQAAVEFAAWAFKSPAERAEELRTQAMIEVTRGWLGTHGSHGQQSQGCLVCGRFDKTICICCPCLHSKG